ncbi:hypothetical protein QTN25_008382 [Entamoeba marina]
MNFLGLLFLIVPSLGYFHLFPTNHPSYCPEDKICYDSLDRRINITGFNYSYWPNTTDASYERIPFVVNAMVHDLSYYNVTLTHEFLRTYSPLARSLYMLKNDMNKLNSYLTSNNPFVNKIVEPYASCESIIGKLVEKHMTNTYCPRRRYITEFSDDKELVRTKKKLKDEMQRILNITKPLRDKIQPSLNNLVNVQKNITKLMKSINQYRNKPKDQLEHFLKYSELVLMYQDGYKIMQTIQPIFMSIWKKLLACNTHIANRNIEANIFKRFYSTIKRRTPKINKIGKLKLELKRVQSPEYIKRKVNEALKKHDQQVKGTYRPRPKQIKQVKAIQPTQKYIKPVVKVPEFKDPIENDIQSKQKEIKKEKKYITKINTLIEQFQSEEDGTDIPERLGKISNYLSLHFFKAKQLHSLYAKLKYGVQSLDDFEESMKSYHTYNSKNNIHSVDDIFKPLYLVTKEKLINEEKHLLQYHHRYHNSHPPCRNRKLSNKRKGKLDFD